MNFLTSPMGLAVLGALLHFGTLTAMLMPALSLLQPPPPPESAPEKTQLPDRMWNFKTQAVDEMIAELKKTRANLDQEAKEAAILKTQIAAERAELEKVQKGIVAMREELEKRIIEVQEPELKNLKTLANTYSTMKPPAAVAILREMDENTVVKMLSLMKADQVAPILGEMPKAPDRPGEETMARRAARISDKLRLIKSAK
jgi:flagellar motility protein MotE (MotC chaperone)